jgi:hypothetical protein
MPSLKIELGGSRPLLDIASYARRGPGRGERLSPADIEQISLTVNRAPEVMVKVLSRGGQDSSAVQRHIGYIGRHGDLEIETDEGKALKGPSIGKDLLEEWDLDLDQHRRHAGLAAAHGRQPPKLVHKLMFSMPSGTPPEKLLTAVRNWAREQFALQHSYAMVLHTDEPHPHVHMVVKAVSEQGVRLNIRKDTLRSWRREFARHLRVQGVPANATERAVRGESRSPKTDGMYRASTRAESWRLRDRLQLVLGELAGGGIRVEGGKATLLETRRHVERGWAAASDALATQGDAELASQVRSFVAHMTPPKTEKEWLAHDLLQHAHRVPRRSIDGP